MIRLENIQKKYKEGGSSAEKIALENISLKIEQGEFVAIMGTSGSGKSTLLNLLGCMDTVTKGEYYFMETPIHKLSTHKLHKFRKQNISFVFQNFALMNYYTVYENIELPLLAKNVSRKKRREIVKEQMIKMGIEDLSGKLPTQISGGQQQRCAIARALASGNEVILADEPTGALDSRTSKEIVNILEELNQMGKTIIMVTHDENVAKQTKRILRIEDGHIISDSSLSSVRAVTDVGHNFPDSNFFK